MADASKLRGLARLGSPPGIEEARDLAPQPAAEPPPAPRAGPSPESVLSLTPRIDARTLRRSGRTVHFATKVTPHFDNRLREIAAQSGKMLTELLEEMLDLYEKAHR